MEPLREEATKLDDDPCRERPIPRLVYEGSGDEDTRNKNTVPGEATQVEAVEIEATQVEASQQVEVGATQVEVEVMREVYDTKQWDREKLDLDYVILKDIIRMYQVEVEDGEVEFEGRDDAEVEYGESEIEVG